MKKRFLTVMVLGTLWLAGCNLQQDTATEVTEATQAKYDWSLPQVVYQQAGKIYFHNPVTGQNQLLEEESDEIFSLVFDDASQTLYYTVVQADKLGLKKATLESGKIKIESLKGLGIAKEKFITETYAEYSPLEIHGGKLLLMSDFSWDGYGFSRYNIYSPADDSWTATNEVEEASDLLGGAKLWGLDESQPFVARNQQLFYTGGKGQVAVSDKLGLKADMEHEAEVEFYNFSASPGGSKVAFTALLGMSDLPHGPLCIANADGSGQRILAEEGMSKLKKAAWLGENLVFPNPLSEQESAEDESSDEIAEVKLMMAQGQDNQVKELAAKVRSFTLVQGR